MHAVIAAHLPAVHSVAVHGLNGKPLAVGVVLAVVAAAMWHHRHHWERFMSWLFAVAAGCITVAIPPFFDAIAALPTFGAGMVAFLIVAAFSIIGFWLQAVRTHKKNRLAKLLGGKKAREPGKGLAVLGAAPRPNRHKRIGTPVTSMVAGVVFVVTIGAWRLILKSASIAVAGTLQQLATSSKQVNNGHAAAASAPSDRVGIYIVAVIVVLVVIPLVMRHHDKPKNKGSKGSGQGTPRGAGGIPLMGGGSR